jgi:hypothetical protein
LLGLNMPSALREAALILFRTTIGCMIVTGVCMLALPTDEALITPMVLAALFGHLTIGLSILAAARARYLSTLPAYGSIEFLLLIGANVIGGFLTMFGSVSTLMLCATIVAHG